MKRACAILLTVSLAARSGLTDDSYAYDWANGTVNLGPEIQINSPIDQNANHRFIIFQGTVNLNEGADIQTGGNATSTCNYIGVDRGYPANLNINGGSFWCTQAGGGAGDLGIGINNNGVSSSLTLNAGTLRVDGRIRSGVYWNSLSGVNSSGTVSIKGGEAFVNQLIIGSEIASTGSSTLNLNGGRLTVNDLRFLTYNGQTFTWGNGTLVAGSETLFSNIGDYVAVNGKTRTMTVTGAPGTFDTAGFILTLPPFTGTGKLRLTGGGTVMFDETALSYGLILDDVTLILPTIAPDQPALSLPDLEIAGPVALEVDQVNNTEKFPVLSWTRSFSGSIAQISFNNGDPTHVVREGNTLFFSEAGDPDALIYADLAGGDNTPAGSSYTRLLFTDTAGALTVNGDGLTFSQEIADLSAASQRVTAPVTLSAANSSIYVAPGGWLELAGGLTATSPAKEGGGTLVLSHTALPETLTPKEGILDFGGNTYAGGLNFRSRRFHGEEIVLTNGMWRPNGQTGFEFQGSTITLAEGFTADLTANADSRIAISYAGVDGDAGVISKLIIAGGTFLTAGNNSNVANFVGVDRSGTAILEVNAGTFHATGPNGGYLRVAANNRPFLTGIVRVNGGLLKLDRDLSLATVWNGLSAGTGKGVFELAGGVADIENLYVGATSSSTGRGEVNLTGGVLEVGQLKCLPYCARSVTADGATIRAKRDDSDGVIFLAADESSDNYAKSYTIGSGGLTVDTAGHTVGCTIPWRGEGGITVTGGGTLLLDSALELTGNMVVTDETTLQLSCSQTFAGTFTLGDGARLILDLSNLGNDVMRIATGGFILPEGVSDVLACVELSDTLNYVVKTVDEGKTIEVSSSAGVPVIAIWTGAAGTNDLTDPANWICKNAAGGVVEHALPGPTATIYLDGATAFTIPPDATPNWVGIYIGASGAVTLSADCDWSKIAEVTLADRAVLDLNGHNLKVKRLVAAEDGIAAVTNSVAGVRPTLWRANGTSESELVDTEHVTVYTETLQLQLVTEGEYVTPQNTGIHIGVALDADYLQTNGTVMAASARDTGTLIGDNGFSGSYTLAGEGNATFGYIHLGTKTGATGGSHGELHVSGNVNLKTLGWITIGHGGGSTADVTQNGGTIEVADDLNVGCYADNSGTYTMDGGTLIVSRNLVSGREHGTGLFTLNGGTVTVNGSLVPGMGPSTGTFVQADGFMGANSFMTIGYNGGNGTYRLTGGELSVTKQPIYISQGNGSVGLLDIAGGVATAEKGVIVGFSSKGALCIRDGGQLVTTGITNQTGQATVTFDGGKLKALKDNPAFICGITDMVFGPNGLTLDNSGYDLAFTGCTLTMTPENPAITMTGSGTLDLSDTTVELPDDPVGAFTVATATTGTFTGVPAFGKKGWAVRLAPDGKSIRIINPGFLLIVN